MEKGNQEDSWYISSDDKRAGYLGLLCALHEKWAAFQNMAAFFLLSGLPIRNQTQLFQQIRKDMKNEYNCSNTGP